MILSIIAAVDEGGGLGFNNRLSWHLPRDLARFKKITMGHNLILGRKTYLSIGKPLPGRQMIVLSRNPEFKMDGIEVVQSLEQALKIARDRRESEAFVIGGGEIYKLALPLVDKMYLTCVHTVHQADVFFPDYGSENWFTICEQEFPADSANPVGSTFCCLIRKTP